MKRVLVVDDEFSIVETLGEVLEWEGYQIASAGNGQSGLEAARAAPPALILLDYMMPVMDGLQMLRALRADPALARVPVIMLTAAPLGIPEADRLWDALLLKPFEAAQLVRVIARLIGPSG
jgi:CheY-like chemotaxis protein